VIALRIVAACCLLVAEGAWAQALPAIPASPGVPAVIAANRDPRDPYEGYNRLIFRLNDSLDEAVIAPVARGYQKVVPQPFRNGVSNFFGNFGDAWSAINHLLQGKPTEAAEMTIRVAANTMFGIGGLFDVASELGIERRSEDFGQTLGRWGLPAGPYLVLPALGPSTVRDAAARPLDMAWSPSQLVNDEVARGSLTALSLIDTRASLLRAGQLLDNVALDRYVFLRDAYLSRRNNLVYDGNPPEPKEMPLAPEVPASAAPKSTPK
jgi:phospholipid-binding lipoprotein MlaA